MKRIATLRGLWVALTGRCSQPRRRLARLIKSRGGHVDSTITAVTGRTDILVRGESESWKYGGHGRKEAKAAEMIRNGMPLSVILSEDLDALLAGKPVTECAHVAGHRVDDLRVQVHAASLDEKRITTQRLEQGKLRDLHFSEKDEAGCSLCGRVLPVQLLVVGHIKPRARCKTREKLDFMNVTFPVCSLGCDALYERGFVTVSPNGRVVVASDSLGSRALSGVLRRLSGRTCPAHSGESEPYFAWHRKNIFM